MRFQLFFREPEATRRTPEPPKPLHVLLERSNGKAVREDTLRRARIRFCHVDALGRLMPEQLEALKSQAPTPKVGG